MRNCVVLRCGLEIRNALLAQGSEESWPLAIADGSVVMADHAIALSENVDQIVWWIEDWSSLWSLFEVLVVTLLLGFALGYTCAVKFGKARGKTILQIPNGTQIVLKNSVGTQINGPPSRSIAAQSMCTYKRKLVTPRFQVLPQQADGVFDVSFSE